MNRAIVILPDIPRLYTALAEWIACMLCIVEMKRRISGWKLWGSCAIALVVQGTFLKLTEGMQGIFWILGMLAAIALMYAFLYLCSDTGWKDIAYVCVCAFATAEFAASLEWQIDCVITYSLEYDRVWLHPLLLVLIYSLVYTVSGLVFRKYAGEKQFLPVTNRELRYCIIIVAVTFFISNMGFLPWNTPYGGISMSELYNMRTLIDLGGLLLLYAYHAQRTELRVRHELENVESILHNQYTQYKQSQEIIDMINYKYHDLKHHIIALRAENNAQSREEYLDKMEEEIRNYEVQNKTGNRVLDTMLTTKKLTCLKNDITMTSVVDGALFNFMDTMDICSIFGNALDNAIEYEKKIPDKEKRLIHVLAFTQKNFIIIRFENYCEEQLEFVDGLPKTTRADAGFHGYGLKSLRYTVRKYGGEVDAENKNDWFILKILIPMEIV